MYYNKGAKTKQRQQNNDNKKNKKILKKVLTTPRRCDTIRVQKQTDNKNKK